MASGPGTWLGADNIQQPVGQQPQRPRRSMRGEHGAEEISAVGRWEMVLTCGGHESAKSRARGGGVGPECDNAAQGGFILFLFFFFLYLLYKFKLHFKFKLWGTFVHRLITYFDHTNCGEVI